MKGYLSILETSYKWGISERRINQSAAQAVLDKHRRAVFPRSRMLCRDGVDCAADAYGNVHRLVSCKGPEKAAGFASAASYAACHCHIHCLNLFLSENVEACLQRLHKLFLHGFCRVDAGVYRIGDDTHQHGVRKNI